MTISDLRCDGCGNPLAGLVRPGAPATSTARLGVRFLYHPGDESLGDDAGLMCVPCWDRFVATMAPIERDRCARCAADVSTTSLVVFRHEDRTATWQLCTVHAAEWLNTLRTVDPKLDPATFVLPPRRPPAPDAPAEQRVELRKRR